MVSIADGFAVSTQLLPWGTTLGRVLAQLSGTMKIDQHSAKFQSAQMLGLAGILSVTLRAPALDRPVLQAWYELGAFSNDDLLESVTRILGAPVSQTDYDLRGHANPAFAVWRVLRWDFAGFDVGVSMYGALRETPDGISAAVLYMDWVDEVAAAAPYLAVMTEFEDWLEACAPRVEIVRLETLEVDQHPYQLGASRKASPLPVDSALLRAGRCLRKRLLYQTPASLAASLLPNQVLLWKDTPDSIWCVSTRHETICFQAGQPVHAAHVNMLPAKGSGATFLTISDLSLESIPNSPALTRLTGSLRDEMGVQVSLMEDYDT